ncbi:UNVERIFIED_CONTAM: hypothetical protein FKN15_010970 [Acipenser sinensis]
MLTGAPQLASGVWMSVLQACGFLPLQGPLQQFSLMLPCFACNFCGNRNVKKEMCFMYTCG